MFNENLSEICFSFCTIKILRDKSEDKKKIMEEKKEKISCNFSAGEVNNITNVDFFLFHVKLNSRKL